MRLVLIISRPRILKFKFQNNKLIFRVCSKKLGFVERANFICLGVYFGKAVTSKPKKITDRSWSYFVAPEKSFLTVIWFLEFKFLLTKQLPSKVKRSVYPKSNNNLQYNGPMRLLQHSQGTV